MDVKKRPEKPIKPRRKWVINPKTRVEESGCVYKRTKVKKEIRELYGREEDKA